MIRNNVKYCENCNTLKHISYFQNDTQTCLDCLKKHTINICEQCPFVVQSGMSEGCEASFKCSNQK